jgi:hypothetical protein
MKPSLNAVSAERRGRMPANLEPFAFKPGQSGNPGGRTPQFAECQRLARELSPRAIQRLGELMESEDERVAVVACNSLLDRAWGRSGRQPHVSARDDLSKLSDAEVRERLVASLVGRGLSKKAAMRLTRD